MAYYGRGWTSADGASGRTGGVNSQNQRASVYGTMPEHGWGHTFGGRFGVWDLDPGTSNVRMGAWVIDDDIDPADRLGYSASFNVTNEAGSAGDCQLYTAAVSSTNRDYSPSNSGMMMWSGEQYGIGFSHTGNILFIQQANAADVSYVNEQLYRKNSGTITPSDPFGTPTAVSVEGIMTLFIEYEPNVKPDVPTGLAPTGTINTLTPTFTTTFSDSNSDRGDALKQMQLEVRQGSTTGTVKWNPTVETDDVAYGGASLSAGITYYWRARHSDQFGTWSNWTSWQSFTVNAGGDVATPSSPTGKQETQTPGPFVALWDHASSLSTNAVEIRIRSGATVIRGPQQISKTVADNANISISWGDTGFTALPWGSNLNFQIRGRDTGNQWSDWSPPRYFTTNAYPTVPATLKPANNQAVSTPPLLTLKASDPDDNVASGLTVSARIKDNAGNVIQTRTMTYNGTLDQWEYQTVAGVNEVQRVTRTGTASGGTWAITVPTNLLGSGQTASGIAASANAATIQAALEALSNVGVGNVSVTGGPISSATTVDITFKGALGGNNLSQITLGNSLTGSSPVITPSTVTGGVVNDLPIFATYKWDARSGDGTLNSNYSAEAIFAYGNGPVVTGTYPTASLTISTNTPVITWTATGQVKYQVLIFQADDDLLIHDSGLIVSGSQSYPVPTGYLFNNTDYYYIVNVENAVPLPGSSLAITFTVSYPAPDVVANFLASPIAVAGDTAPTAVLLSWEAAEDAPSNFVEYIGWRRDLATNEEIILFRLSSIQQTTFIDYLPASNTTYEYSIAKTIIQGSNEDTTSDREYSQASVSIPFPLIVPVSDGSDNRAALRLMKDFNIDHKDDTTYVFTWGDDRPTAIIGTNFYDVLTGSFDIITDQSGTAESKIKILRNLMNMRTIVCYRDERGQRVFGYMTVKEQYQRLGFYVVQITITQVNYIEGVE